MAHGHAWLYGGSSANTRSTAVLTSTTYSEFESIDDQRLAKNMLERLRVVEHVLMESDPGEADLIVEGEVSNNLLDAPSVAMTVLEQLTLIWFLGVPVYETGRGSANLRVYDSTGRFVEEYNEQGRAKRWHPWGGTVSIAPSRVIVGPAAASYALAGALSRLAEDIDSGRLDPELAGSAGRDVVPHPAALSP
jgi:hypothetical protein